MPDLDHYSFGYALLVFFIAVAVLFGILLLRARRTYKRLIKEAKDQGIKSMKMFEKQCDEVDK